MRRVGRTSWSGVATRGACVRSTVRLVGSLNRWSLSGGTSITLANGILSPQHLLVEPDQAILQASLSQGGSTFPRSNDVAMPMHDLGDLTIVDDQGVRYLASVKSSSGSWRQSGEPIGSTHLTILITPAPKAGIAWLELRGPNGSMSRLTRPTQCAIQVGPITPVEKNVQHNVRDFVAHDSISLSDGPEYHMALGVSLELEGFSVRLDSLESCRDEWRLHLGAEPGWWLYSENRKTKWAIVSIQPEDNLGNTYEDRFGGSRPHLDHDDLTLIFHPRLDPRAASVKLVVQGSSHQVILSLDLL